MITVAEARDLSMEQLGGRRIALDRRIVEVVRRRDVLEILRENRILIDELDNRAVEIELLYPLDGIW